MKNILGFIIDDRIVVHRIELIQKHFLASIERIENGAQDLRDATQGIVFLDFFGKHVLFHFLTE